MSTEDVPSPWRCSFLRTGVRQEEAQQDDCRFRSVLQMQSVQSNTPREPSRFWHWSPRRRTRRGTLRNFFQLLKQEFRFHKRLTLVNSHWWHWSPSDHESVYPTASWARAPGRTSSESHGIPLITQGDDCLTCRLCISLVTVCVVVSKLV